MQASHRKPGLRHVVLALAALACAVPATRTVAADTNWTMGQRVQGNGVLKKQAREVGHFTGLAVDLSGAAELHIGNTEGVTIETDANLLPLIETVVEQGVLHVRPARRHLNLQTRNLRIVVTAREIRSLALGGSGAIAADPLRSGALNLSLGGSGSIDVKSVEARDVTLVIGGSGNLKVGGGSADNLAITIGGSGDIDAARLQAKDVSITVGGSGHSTVWARDALSYTIAGSGNVSYYGDPRVSRTVLGSGGARRLGAAPR